MVNRGDKAPDFELPNAQNQRIKLSTLIPKDGPLLVVFYKFNCPTCQFTFQYLPRIAKQLDQKYFLAVAQDTVQEATDFKNKYDVGFEIACDMKPYTTSVEYGLDFVPTFFVIEGDGTVSDIAEGFDKTFIENFAARVAQLKGNTGFVAFRPNETVPLLKPG